MISTQRQDIHSITIKLWFSGGKEEHEQTINTEHWKMNFVLTLEESFSGYLKQQAEHSMYEFQTVIHLFQTWKKITNWNENGINIHVRKLHIERKDDTWISAMEDYHSSAILFISRKVRNKLQWRASSLESFPTNPFLPLPRVHLYYLRPEANPWTRPGNCFQSQLDTNILVCGTISMIYKY